MRVAADVAKTWLTVEVQEAGAVHLLRLERLRQLEMLRARAGGGAGEDGLGVALLLLEEAGRRERRVRSQLRDPGVQRGELLEREHLVRSADLHDDGLRAAASSALRGSSKESAPAATLRLNERRHRHGLPVRPEVPGSHAYDPRR